MEYVKKKFVDEENRVISWFSTDDNILCNDGKLLREKLNGDNITYISPQSLDEFVELTKEGGLFYLLTTISLSYNNKTYNVLGLIDSRPHSNGYSYYAFHKMWQFLINPDTKSVTSFSSFAEFIQNKIPSDASKLSIIDVNNNFTSENVEEALNELFQYASNGKGLIATAITGKGVDASSSDTFAQLANKIGQISTGTTNIDGLVVTIDGIKYVLSKDSGNNIIATKVKYSITNNLTNATNNNPVTEVEHNNSYSANISANTGYKLSNITVTMNNVDITSSVYNNGNINISNVTGNIVITVTTEKDIDGVVGSIDNNNNISLIGLSTGTYTLKYEDDNGNVLGDFGTITTMEVI